MNVSPIVASVRSLAASRRRHARGITLAGWIAALIGAIALLALVDLRTEWSSSSRIAIALAVAAGFLIFLFRRLSQARRHDTKEAARLIEDNHPEMGQKLRTALEVSSRPRPVSPEAAAFTDRLLQETTRELDQKPWRRLVPRKTLWKRRAIAVAAFAAILFTASQWSDFRFAVDRILHPHQALTYTRVDWRALPTRFDDTHPARVEFEISGRVAEPRLFVKEVNGQWKPFDLTKTDGRRWDAILPARMADFHFKVEAGDSIDGEHIVRYRPIPKLTDSSATVRYPTYTGMPDETSPGGDVRALEDSTATWRFVFNTPPDRATWCVAGVDPVELTPKTGTAEYSASSVIKTGKVQGELAIFGSDGERIDSWHFEIEGIVDKMPQVEIIEPKKDLELISTAEMPIRLRAKDDFGVAEVGLILEASGERKWVMEKVVGEKNLRQISELVSVMLEEHQLTITDNVRVHAYALDHKPRGGPRAVSKLLSIDIRQFQMRLVNGLNAKEGKEEEKIDPEAVTDALKKIEELIRAERSLLSDLFATKESFRTRVTPEVKEKATEHSDSQEGISINAENVGNKWLNSGQIPADDVNLMFAATDQMKEAVLHLRRPDLAAGFVSGDRALSTLLQLRKELIAILMKGVPKDPSPLSNPPPPLADLAKEARRLAAEEKDVRSQVEPGAPAGNNITSTKRQQEVALSDTGELFAKLVDHPERSEGALMLMDDADKTVARADSTLNGADPSAATSELALAERQLLDFAVFMESMDLKKLSDTLRKLADKADKAADEQKEAEEKAGMQADAGQSEGSGGAEGKPGEEKKENEQAKAEGEKPKDGEGEKPKDSAKGKDQGEIAAKAAKDTELAEKILEELARKAAPAEPGEESTPAGNALAGLAKRTDPGQLADDLGKLSGLEKDGKGGGEESAGLWKETNRQLGELAREYRETADRLDANRLAELAKAREQAEKLKAELAGKEPGEGKDGLAGKEKGEGEKGDKGEGKEGKEGKDGEGDKPGLAKNEKDGKGKGEGDKPGDQRGKGDMLGDKEGLAANGKDGKEGGGKDEGEKPGKGKGGEKEGDGTEPGGRGPRGQGPALDRFADTLEDLGDPSGLGKFSIPLRAAPFDRSTIPLVDAADQRLQQLQDELPKDQSTANARNRLPEQSRREIEDYFRDLSDDFGGEEWEKSKQ